MTLAATPKRWLSPEEARTFNGYSVANAVLVKTALADRGCTCEPYADVFTCEDDDWHVSEAYQFCDALRHAAIHSIHGYDNANGWTFRRPVDSGAIILTDLIPRSKR